MRCIISPGRFFPIRYICIIYFFLFLHFLLRCKGSLNEGGPYALIVHAQTYLERWRIRSKCSTGREQLKKKQFPGPPAPLTFTISDRQLTIDSMTIFQRFNIDNTSDNDNCLINASFTLFAPGCNGRENLHIYSKSFRIARLNRINRKIRAL